MIPFIMYLPSYHVGPDFTDTVLLETEKVLGIHDAIHDDLIIVSKTSDEHDESNQSF